MPGSESFDAFYARTVWNVTSQMHALAGEDSAADHAIREAYARAYQQWYEIADHPDTENWVLAVAREAYERRRPEVAARPARPATPGHDSLSWPGLYRPRTPAGSPVDPAATIGGSIARMAGPSAVGAGAQPAADLAARPGAGGVGLVGSPSGAAGGHGGSSPRDGSSVTAALPGAGDAAPPARPKPPGLPRRLSWPGSRRNLVALTAAIAVIVGGGALYLATRGSPARQPAQHGAARNHGPVMLAAGKTGSRGAIPWSIVGPGWTVAEVSTGAAGTSRPGQIITYLVDPEGGRYEIQTTGAAPGSMPQLLAWSGDAQNALFAVPSGPSSATYELLSLTSGDMTNLPLPANVTAVGFTRPDGLAILAVRDNPDAFKLERYTLQGGLEATIGSLPRKPDSPEWLPGCGTTCGALSSPDGQTDVWGVTGDQMQLVGNADGKVTGLTVPGSATCVPLSWWNASTVLSYCRAGAQSARGQLWLVPTDGSGPAQLTQTSGSASGQGDLIGAWQAAGVTYVAATNFRECPGAQSGPGGLSLVPVSGESLQRPITVGGATNNHTSIVSVSGGNLLLLAQTSCPGTSSLVKFDPSTGVATTLVTVPAGEVGVLAAVPYGLGSTATNGQ
jgi:TolB protein